MPGLPRIFSALLLSSLFAGSPGGAGAAKALEAEADGQSAPEAGSVAITPRADGPEVDAFLGIWRSSRIAQVIPDHARVCLPSAGGSLRTDVQRVIAAGVGLVAETPLGAWLIGEAATRLVLICHDPHTDLAAYYRSQMRLIGLFERLPGPARIMFLAHELAHVPQHPRFSNDLRFGAHAMLVIHRMREATAEAVATRVLWQLRARGHAEPWQHKLASAYGDIARAFAEAIQGAGETAELHATRAAFDQWFRRPGRVNSYDARMLQHVALISGHRPGAGRITRHVSDDFLRGIGWYAGATFLPLGDGPALTEPYYASRLSPSNAARLKAMLERAM